MAQQSDVEIHGPMSDISRVALCHELLRVLVAYMTVKISTSCLKHGGKIWVFLGVNPHVSFAVQVRSFVRLFYLDRAINLSLLESSLLRPFLKTTWPNT